MEPSAVGASHATSSASQRSGAATAVTRTIADGTNEFAVELYARLAVTQKGNLFFSPSSIHAALAMTYAGAAGDTADQMARTMRYPLASDTLAGPYGELLKALNTPRLTYKKMPAYELVISNALWPAKGYPFRPTFTDLVQKEYGATVQELDYANEPRAARKNINSAVAQQTRDKIKDLVPESAITPLTRLILTNAIYFKSHWAETFRKGGAKHALFTTGDGTRADCPMMQHQGHHGYYENDKLQVLEMPYEAHELSMLVLLPKKADGLPQLEETLSAGQVVDWTRAAKDVPVRVSFPRFTFSRQFGLAETLKAMGMSDAFAPERADFSGMTTAEKLAISAVIHQAFVAVDEEGTEAAAATAVRMDGASQRPEEPRVFTADHPFVFLIRHNASGAILFAGRLVAPEGGGKIGEPCPSDEPLPFVDDRGRTLGRLPIMRQIGSSRTGGTTPSCAGPAR